jgi:hypothetical protein
MMEPASLLALLRKRSVTERLSGIFTTKI